MPRWRREAILDLYILVLGVFLFVSPWLYAFTSGAIAKDAWFTAAPIVLISLATLLVFAEWEEWLNLALGLWIAVSPWILGFTHTTAMHLYIGIGLFIAFLSALEIWLIHYDARSRATA